MGRHRRILRTLALCLPALLGGCAAVGLALAASLTPRDELISRYLQEADRSWQAKDYPEARTCAERLTRLERQSDESRYRLALILEAQGESERATGIMDELAPLDRPGHAPAQLWKAVWLLRQPDLPPSGSHDVEIHLRRVLEAQPDSAAAHTLLGLIYAKTGRAKEAEFHLARGATDHPEMYLLLANVCAAQGETASAREWAEAALEVFRGRTKAHPDGRASRLHGATAAVFLEDFARAEATLQEGLARGDAPDYHRALAHVYLAWSNALAKTAPANPGAGLTLLERGLRHDPADVDLLERLGAVMNKEGAEADRARATLQGLLADSRAAPTVHFLLGLDAWRRHRSQEARRHWEQAHQMAPELVAATNNLAWALASGPDADLPRALELIAQALDHSPGRPSFRGTRGHVLVRMKRWREALADLEAALPVEGNSSSGLHRDLAETYAALGLPESVAEHQRCAVRDTAK